MKKQITDSRRVGIFGASGSGKTTKALTLVAKCQRLIVFDALDDFVGKFRRFTSLDDLKSYLIKNYVKGFRVAYVPPYGSEIKALSDLSKFIRELQTGFKIQQHNAKITLFVDELNLSFPLGLTRKKPDNGFGFLCNQGRHYGVNLIGVSQRMSLVDMPFRANLSDLYIFRLADWNDVKTAISMLGTPYKGGILNLQNYKYYYKNEQGIVA
ncbi:MAG: hypothetical protein IJ525_03745 [Alphaproteobacteria bacterium]|nr:hypothetical protein [Alphaproteobacteria bacterium]